MGEAEPDGSSLGGDIEFAIGDPGYTRSNTIAVTTTKPKATTNRKTRVLCAFVKYIFFNLENYFSRELAQAQRWTAVPFVYIVTCTKIGASGQGGCGSFSLDETSPSLKWTPAEFG